MPKSVEHYQQETGRAGRDGLEAECVLFYSAADAMRWESLIERSAADTADPEQVIAAAKALLDPVRRFCTVPQCRHRALSAYFGQEYTSPKCEACDLCLEEAEGLQESTEIAQKILSCVARIEQSSGTTFGVTHTVDVLLGANTDAIRRCRHDQLSTHGILKSAPKKTLTNWVYQLLDQDLLARTHGDRPVLRLNQASWEVMRGGRPVHFMAVRAGRVKDARRAIESWEGVDRGLFEHLKGIRRRLAERSGLPAFLILGDTALVELARRRPTTMQALTHVFGIGETKRAKFGDLLLAEIASYCRMKDLSVNVEFDGSEADDDAPGSSRRGSRRTRGKLSPAKDHAFKMFANGATVLDVAASLERSSSTVSGYLCDFIESTKPSSIAHWVVPATYQAVAGAADVVGRRRLKPIFDRLEGNVPYDDIRLVVAHLDSRDGDG
jgi:ATP-dependent DNA helicase RecQ